MKQITGWWLPDHEKHLIEWMATPKNKVMRNGRQAYQGVKQLAVLALCKRFNTAIDVGAHVGFWSYNLAHDFKRVQAFEPVEEHRNCFERNTRGLANIQLHPIALGREPGSVAIKTENGSSGNSYVCGTGQIEMRTLDSFNFPSVGLIKIDCEGSEENILRGGVETIKKWKPTIIVEQKRDHATRFGLQPLGAVDFLIGLGYTVAKEISGDYIMVHE